MTKYHWIMTVQYSGITRTLDGTVSVFPDSTHESTYYAVKESVANRAGTDDFAVVSFVLAPNQLGAA